MPRVHIPDNEKYGQALYLLHYRIGGSFQTRPTHVLLVGQGQYEALVQAGLVEPEALKASDQGKDEKDKPNGVKAKARGKKKKEV